MKALFDWIIAMLIEQTALPRLHDSRRHRGNTGLSRREATLVLAENHVRTSR
jgi:hypothetical protein